MRIRRLTTLSSQPNTTRAHVNAPRQTECHATSTQHKAGIKGRTPKHMDEKAAGAPLRCWLAVHSGFKWRLLIHDAPWPLLHQAKKINRSLSALGNVVAALTSPTATYIPFRDSKLTRLLTDVCGVPLRPTPSSLPPPSPIVVRASSIQMYKPRKACTHVRSHDFAAAEWGSGCKRKDKRENQSEDVINLCSSASHACSLSVATPL